MTNAGSCAVVAYAWFCPTYFGTTYACIKLFIVGFWLSVTVTVKLQELLPQPLDALMVTFVTPILNVDPAPVPLPLPVVAPVNVYEILVGLPPMVGV